MIRCSACVDLHRPCADCEEWAREAAEDLALAESGAYVGEFVRSAPVEQGKRIVQAALGSAELVQLAMEMFGKVGLPHVGGTAIPGEVLEERARNLVAALLAGWRVVRREYEGTSEEAEAHARRIIS